MNESKWIGFDLDGTLAKITVGNTIGKQIKELFFLLLKINHEGKYQVKIFTARAESKEKTALIKQWLRLHHLPDVEITNVKDGKCVLIIDNIAVRVFKDSGVICHECLNSLLIKFSAELLDEKPQTINSELL